jgi:ABC-type phosphate transport system substrate-binding protein
MLRSHHADVVTGACRSHQKGNPLRKSMFCRAAAVGAVALTATGGFLAAGASAAPVPVDLTVVGSNTTQEVMGAIVTTYNSSAAAKAADVKATNIDAVPAGAGTVALSDSHCNGGVSITYIAGSNPTANQRTAPNGSGAGRTALATSVTNGDSCTSVARSSSAGSSTDPAGTEAYAYAVDAVTWATASTGYAPANLSITQLEAIYACKYTNWSQVGGKSAPIERYFPQTGSGSGTFMAGVLGFDPRVVGGANTCSTPATQIEENEATAIPAASAKDAIMVYSAGEWVAQANAVDPNLQNGFVLHSINGKANPVTKVGKSYVLSSIVTEANVEPSTYLPTSTTAVQGIRNLFNFINTNSVDYAAAAAFVGASSTLCNGGDAATISKYGFAPLAKCIEQS